MRFGIIILMLCIAFGCGQKEQQTEASHVSNVALGKKIDTLQLQVKIQGLWQDKPNGIPYFFIKGDSIFYPHHDYTPNSYSLAVDTLVEKESSTGNRFRYVITKIDKDSLCMYNLNKDQFIKLSKREIDEF